MPGAPSSDALVPSSFLFLVYGQEPLVAPLRLVLVWCCGRSTPRVFTSKVGRELDQS